MQNHAGEDTPKQVSEVSEKEVWTKPSLDEFGIAVATQNAGIINLDADHALDVS